MSYDSEELETFLIEAELISQKVKALAENRITPEEVDKIEAARADDRRRKQEYKLRIQREGIEKQRRGRDEKGITKDFKHFCRYCHKEYVFDTPKCIKCERPTMTLQQRQSQLQAMVEDYKYNKKSREDKKHKWEMFQKTEAAMWKKSSINYSQKWEYFVEESDQQQDKQPILPTNDPNFKALQMDIEERKKRRAKDTEKAKSLKDKGNASMKEGDYQKAMEFYTLALEHIKDLKSVYTNRALAFIKLKKYKKAITDCTNVIEYMEIFQKVGENRDLTFKAFSRRALAHKERKQYKQALEDANQALKLIPNDKTVLLLKKEIESFVLHTETVQKLITENKNKQNQDNNKEEIEESEQEKQGDSKKIEREIIQELAEKQLKQQEIHKIQKKQDKKVIQQQNPIKEIPKRLQSLNDQNVQYLLNLLFKQKDLRSIFISAKGIQKTIDYIFSNESSHKQTLLICYCLDGEGVAEQRVWDWGIYKFYDKILQKFKDQTKLNQSIYDFIDNLFQILVPVSLYEPYRLQLASSSRSYEFIQFMFPKLITKFKKQPTLLDNFIILISNLSSGQSQFKNQYLKKQKFTVIVDSLFLILIDYQSKNRKILELKQSSYSLISNLITNISLRKTFIQFAQKNNRFATICQDLQLYPRQAHNFQGYIQNLLSMLANASLDTSLELMNIADVIFQRFISQWQNYSSTILYRGLLTISRFKYASNQKLTNWMKIFDRMVVKFDPIANSEEKNVMQIVKILNVLFMCPGPQTIATIPPNLLKTLNTFIGENDVQQNLFCNTCNLFGVIIDKQGPLRGKILTDLCDKIKKLVQISKQKTGNWRKSAAILLAKTSSDPKCRSELDRHHGMQVLKSIAPFITDKK